MGLFSKHFQQATSWIDPAAAAIGRNDPIAKSVLNWAVKKGGPPGAPGVPNPNDAANQAQSLTDQMRMRRGLMANIYAGGATGAGSQPVTGKTALGT